MESKEKGRLNGILMFRLMLVLTFTVIFYFPLLFLPFWINYRFYPLIIDMFCWATRINIHNLSEDYDTKGETFIYASNHKSFADPVFISKFIPKPFAYSMSAHLFRICPPFKIIALKMRFVSVDTSSIKRLMNSYRTLQRRIKRGISVIFFPEGYYTIDRPVGSMKGGIAKIAKNTGVRVRPVALYGFDQRFVYKKRLQHQDGYVKIGEPLCYDDYNDERTFLAALEKSVEELYLDIERSVSTKNA